MLPRFLFLESEGGEEGVCKERKRGSKLNCEQLSEDTRDRDKNEESKRDKKRERARDRKRERQK